MKREAEIDKITWGRERESEKASTCSPFLSSVGRGSISSFHNTTASRARPPSSVFRYSRSFFEIGGSVVRYRTYNVHVALHVQKSRLCCTGEKLVACRIVLPV